MRSEKITRGKGTNKRHYWKHTGSNGIEATILQLLDSLKNIDHAEFMADTTDIVTLHDFAIMKRDTRKELYACLA